MRKGSLLERIAASCLVTVGLAGAMSPVGCNNSNRGKAFPVQPQTTVGQLQVYFAYSMTPTERQECTEAIREHWRWFNSYYGVPQGAQTRSLRIYDVPMINSPWQLNQLGWATVDAPHIIRGVKGSANETPDVLRQLVKSYWYPYVVYDQDPAAIPSAGFWFIVRADQSYVNSTIRSRRPQYP